MSGVLSKANMHKKFNMDNPNDREFILQYMLADVSEEDSTDSCILDSEDEFSGEDVGDDSDLEDSDDDIEINCEVGRELATLHCEKEIVESVNDQHLSKSPLLQEEDISCGTESSLGKTISFESNDVNTLFSPTSVRVQHGSEIETPVTATRIDKMSICSGTPVADINCQSPISSKNLVMNGLNISHIARIRDEFICKKRKVTAACILEYLGMEFDNPENRKNARIQLSKEIAKQKEEAKNGKKDLLYSSKEIVISFKGFGVINPEDVMRKIDRFSLTPRTCSPKNKSCNIDNTPCRSSQSSAGRKKKDWGSIQKSAVLKRIDKKSKDVATELTNFVEESGDRVSKIKLLQQITKEFLGDSYEVREIPKKVEPSKVLSLQVETQMSRRKMDSVRSFVKNSCGVSLPSREIVYKEKKRRCVPVYHISESTNIKSSGVFCKFKDSIGQFVSQLNEMGILPPAAAPSEGHTMLKISMKDGFDGAGNQLKIKGCKTSTMELMGYVVLRVEDISDPENSKSIWVNQCPNSHFTLRPLALILEKESADLIRELYKLYPESYTPFVVNIGKRPILIHVDIKRSMLDGKVQNIISGRTGSYCRYCKFTASTYYGKVLNKNCDNPLTARLLFVTYEDLLNAYEQVKGDLDKKSSKRLGFCHKPISKQEHMSVLHMIINCCRTIIKNIAIAVSELNKGTIDPIKKKSQKFNATWKKEKSLICGLLLEKLKIRTMEIGRGNTGSGLTGGEARKFFQKTDEICDLVFPDGNKWKSIFKRVLKKLGVLLFLLMSNEPINVPAYRAISFVTLDIIVREIPWMRVIPSLHMVLCHGWEFIERNNSTGLNILSEEALESKHPRARNIRNFNCYQGNTDVNLLQCHQHLQLESDPVLVKNKMGKTFKSKSKRHFDPTDRNYVALIDSKRKKLCLDQ